MKEVESFVSSLDQYMEHICKVSKLNRQMVEQVINTQIAVLIGDFAIKSNSDTFLGSVSLEDCNNVVTLEVNSLIKKLLEGEVDPTLILREIFNNV